VLLIRQTDRLTLARTELSPNESWLAAVIPQPVVVNRPVLVPQVMPVRVVVMPPMGRAADRARKFVVVVDPSAPVSDDVS
jgi:hypothetical protein